jgi:hypothetical protein
MLVSLVLVAFLVLLAFLRFLSNWRSHVIGFPAVDGVLAVACIPAHPCVPILAGGYTSDLLQDYQTIVLWLLDCYFSAIGLSEYQISDWRIQETIGLSDMASRPQSIGLSDIGLRKNHRVPTSAYLKTIL